ncbi:type 3 dihydrofolate reductase [Algibacillus agarilyticus]|uniref:type 3 dihydrofolate reductase n=1 Tax=Algibacillus agarilyticus TaxID=2234133 RepID=UPI000DD0C1F0|nr:type 3 dihydrofolate reductase [Algibacillus agarilyticus]
MKISMIVAMTHENGIGKENQLLWHMPADLQFFKKTTLGKPIIMGRKTFESIGRPLPGRRNIVLSTQSASPHPDVVLVNNIDDALKAAGDVEEVMIIGGGKIYEAFLPSAHQLYITYVDADLDADTYFPELQQNEWQEIDNTPGIVDEKNKYPHRFVILEKANT